MLMLMLVTAVCVSIIEAVFYEDYIRRKNEEISDLKAKNNSLHIELFDAQEFGFCQVCIHSPAVSDNRLCRACEVAANPLIYSD